MRKINKFLIICSIILLIFIASCGQRRCGDGICQNLEEKRGTCPQDCTDSGTITSKAECNNNVCESGENADNCANDCKSGTKVKSIKVINENGVKDMDWHHGKNLIAFGKLSPTDRYYDVYVMNPDGSQEKCLTCKEEGAPQKHNGNQVWHPSGDYIVFTAEREDTPETYDSLAIPGAGIFNDLWAMTSDGNDFYQLTNYLNEKPVRAVIHPQFSHDGKKILWAEKINRGNSFDGGWVMKLADFAIGESKPRLDNIKTLKPGKCGDDCFYESHAFSKDGKKILFSGNLEGQIPYGLDIYEFNLETNELKRLTKTDNDWDEHAHYSPDEKSIAWMSSTSFDIDWSQVQNRNHFDYLHTELWIMDSDGQNAQQLTHFNDKNYPEYLGGKTIVSDSSWGPDGKKLAVLAAYTTKFGSMNSKMFIVELE